MERYWVGEVNPASQLPHNKCVGIPYLLRGQIGLSANHLGRFDPDFNRVSRRLVAGPNTYFQLVFAADSLEPFGMKLHDSVSREAMAVLWFRHCPRIKSIVRGKHGSQLLTSTVWPG
jgi:hypothetical protein